jgi:amino acid transporter
VGDITRLALATSALLLSVFIVVNAALLVLQRRPGEAKGQFEVPSIVPIGGVFVCSAMLISTLFDNDRRAALAIAAVILAVIAVLYMIMRPKNINEETLIEAAE